MRGFAEMIKFMSLARTAKFKDAVHGSVKFQRAKIKARFHGAAYKPRSEILKDVARVHLFRITRFANRAVKF